MIESHRLQIDVVHPHWKGQLELDTESGRVLHLGVGATGRFKLLTEESLCVYWDKYPREVFKREGAVFRKVEARSERLRLLEDIGIVSLTVKIPDSRFLAEVRLESSDYPVFEQVFIKREYEITNIPSDVETIIDLGANVGYASIYFAERYPNARILAVEPSGRNVQMLYQNTQQFGERIQIIQAAAWDSKGSIFLVENNETGTPLGDWGGQVSSDRARGTSAVDCVTMHELLTFCARATVDILKIDIEGAEKEIFSARDLSWLQQVRCIIIETHDRFKPGCEAAVRIALSQDFDYVGNKGENLVFLAKGGIDARFIS